jgi:hypothetical protein
MGTVGDRRMSEKGMMKMSIAHGKRLAGGRPRSVFACCGLVFAAMFFATGAQANSPIYKYATVPTSIQAGGHPDVLIEYKVGNRAVQGFNDPCFCNDPKEIVQGLPQGVIGNPHVTPQCDTLEFAQFRCPVDSQVGIVAVNVYKEIGVGGGIYVWAPLYNMVPHPDQAGLLAFPLPALEGLPQYTVLKSRTGGDYGLTATTIGVERTIPIYGVSVFLWGVPADPIHNSLRFKTTGQNPGDLCINAFENADPRKAFFENRFPSLPTECNNPGPPTTTSNSPLLPFLTNPTSCSGTLVSTLDTTSYDFGTAHSDTTYPGMTGCDLLSFNPSLSAKPTTEETDSASGLDIDLTVPQLQSPETPSPSAIKATTVTLPRGFSINPNAADGKTSCSDNAARFGTEEEANCPESSKVGTLTLDSSALPAPIPGYIYLGDPQPGDRYRIILTANGFATHVKLAGSVVPDPQTGQLVASFQNLPESPLTEFKMHFFGSERGLLATPNQCGTYAVNSTFVPWDGSLPNQEATQFFTLDSGPTGQPCPGLHRSFSPRFVAASSGNTAGAHSQFAVDLTRSDGDQNISGLEVKTPPGFSATLKGIPYCPEAAIAQLAASGYTGLSEQLSPACPAASQVGTAVAGAGAGTHPLYTPGKVYLAGPYKGAPLSLEVVVPAISGPYDLGTIAVRAALRVDPVTAQVTAVSDRLPQILEGIPLRTRSIQVTLDRPNFALNPTNCDPFSVDATISGDEGAVSSTESPFQVANCAALPYRPKLSLRLTGGVNRLGHPAIRAVFQSKPGEANTRSVSVALPKGELLDNAHIGTVCTKVDFSNNACPAESRLGRVEVTTPILDQPLKGPVYLRSSRQGLPDLALDLEGQVDIEASAKIDSVNEGLRTTFKTVPDVPFSSIVLDLVGGKKGLLQNSESLCGANKKATVKMTGQNGAAINTKTKLQVTCGSNARHNSHRHTKKAVH